MTVHPDPTHLLAVAVAAARGHGCICRPDVTIAEEADGIHRADVRHDGWCPVVARTAAAWN